MKIAISVPNELFTAAERLAKEMKVSRSELYARALKDYVEAQSAAAITANLNKIYSAQRAKVDPALMRAQRAVLPDETW